MVQLNYQIEMECSTMKKIFRLLMLGLLTISVFMPNVVDAAEDQTGQEPRSSVYSEIDGIAPMATPFVEEVTLDHGESYSIIRDMIFTPDNDYGLGKPWYLMKVAPLSGEKEAFRIDYLNDIPNSSLHGSDYFYTDQFSYMLYVFDYVPDKVDIRYFGYRITNYSAGPVTYRVGLNITYGSDEGLEYDLFD